MKPNHQTSQSISLVCPFCEHEQKGLVYPVIDLKANPTLKLGLLTDSLFFVTCEACAKQFEVIHEMLVLDEDNTYAIFLAPDFKGNHFDNPEVSNFPGYRLRLVSSVQELKEKILLFAEGLDDKTIELCKLYILMQMENKACSLLFSGHQVVEGLLLFSVFNEKGESFQSLSCEEGLYGKLFARAQEFTPDQTNFSRIDANWAYTAIASI
ncbi:CpXC domain-containing protein [uncultured Sphaerochaeta sp.]|uniref:CpXC domain-containing protein n=1 Tax=uncultured Sphaerochaeta sp. TaxID=886478 RepID=UPI002A0A9CA8|nr:CpXC domain-containing protein [uncultured Sphaerochaeta sp.]